MGLNAVNIEINCIITNSIWSNKMNARNRQIELKIDESFSFQGQKIFFLFLFSLLFCSTKWKVHVNERDEFRSSSIFSVFHHFQFLCVSFFVDVIFLSRVFTFSTLMSKHVYVCVCVSASWTYTSASEEKVNKRENDLSAMAFNSNYHSIPIEHAIVCDAHVEQGKMKNTFFHHFYFSSLPLSPENKTLKLNSSSMTQFTDIFDRKSLRMRRNLFFTYNFRFRWANHIFYA